MMTRRRRNEVKQKLAYIENIRQKTNNIVEACKKAGVTVQEYLEVARG